MLFYIIVLEKPENLLKTIINVVAIYRLLWREFLLSLYLFSRVISQVPSNRDVIVVCSFTLFFCCLIKIGYKGYPLFLETTEGKLQI